MKNNKIIDWIIRFVKGIFIGTGFILPGVSGGALAAIFGLYERMISFIAHLSKEFKKNILFFLPVGIGMLAGIILLSYPLEYALENFAAQTMWCFIGCIIGTFPSLWKQSGKKGREKKHLLIMVLSLVIGFVFLYFAADMFSGSVPQNFGTWIIAGVIIALGVLIPGLSPSNFLLYMDMYNPMVNAFKTLNFAVLIPIGIGGLACMLAFSKLVDIIFAKAYTGMFHVILGVVIASTLIIIPTVILPLNFNYLSVGGFVCILTLAAGVALGFWMSRLEERYKPELD